MPQPRITRPGALDAPPPPSRTVRLPNGTSPVGQWKGGFVPVNICLPSFGCCLQDTGHIVATESISTVDVGSLSTGGEDNYQVPCDDVPEGMLPPGPVHKVGQVHAAKRPKEVEDE
ncbi:unnamed protein product, partial [Polarella glacialis]